MRELIRAEERLMFARHSAPRPIRKEAPLDASRDEEPEPSTFRARLPLCRKELY
jgi:hypothetical protein